MSDNYRRDPSYPGYGGYGGFPPIPPPQGGFPVQHRYQEDDFAGSFAHNQQQIGRNQAPLYARGSNGYQRVASGGGNGHNYGVHRGHPQMGHHQPHQYRQQQQPDGYSNRTFVAPQQQSQSTRFNPNAAVFTPSSQPFGVPSNDMESRQWSMDGPNMYADQGYYDDQFAPDPRYGQGVPPGSMRQYSDFIDDETAAYEAMYSNSQEPQQFVPSQELNQLIASNAASLRIQEVLVGLEQLISDEEDFESWSNAIKERIVVMDKDQRSICIRIMLEMLLSTAPPMVVSGAPPNPSTLPTPGPVLSRLIEVIAREVKDALGGSILPTLHTFHSNRTSYGGNERCVLLKFFADCYDKLETTNGSKIEALGSAVVEHTKELLKPDDIREDRMKAILYALKASGPGLDSSPVTRALNDDVLTLLSAFGKGHPKLSESLKTEIAALIECRESGWGPKFHGVSSFGQLSNLSGAAGSSSSSSVPIGSIIGADGKPLALSEEERTFLEEQFGEEDDDMFAEMDRFMKEENTRLTEKMMEKLKMCDDSGSDKKNDSA